MGYTGMVMKAENGFKAYIFNGDIIKLVSEDQTLKEAYMSRKSFEKPLEAKKALVAVVKDGEILDKEKLEEDFMNLTEQSFLDTFKGKFT